MPYSKPFNKVFFPCDVDGQVALWKIWKERCLKRGFLVTSKSRVDFGIGEMRIDLTMLEEIKDIDVLLDALVENLEEVGSSNGDLVKMGKASQEVKEALDRKYKELEESKPILENYMTYQKKLDEVLMGRARLSSDDYGEEAKMRIVEHGLPKKRLKRNDRDECACGYMWQVVSVLPYCPFHEPLVIEILSLITLYITMADNTQAKAIGEVKNVRIKIGYQAYLVDFLILDMPVDKELPLLLGCLFFRTCRAVTDMGRGTLCIDDGVISHTYFPKPRAKAYLENFTHEEEDDWLSCFKAGGEMQHEI
ncbi:chlorophyll A/B binding protein of LHCII type 1-like protein [Tanacetum coccineum]